LRKDLLDEFSRACLVTRGLERNGENEPISRRAQ